MKTLLLFSWLLLLCGCHTIDPADVEADRARWTALRDITADGVLSPLELAAVGDWLIAWDTRLLADEAAAKRPRDARAIVQDLVRVYGFATVQVFVVPELQARAPELFRLADLNSNGTLEADELLAIDPTSPVFALVVASTVQRLLAKR